MKFLLIAVLILGTLFSTVVAEEQEIDQHVYSKLQEIGGTKFGKTLIDSVAVQMAAGDPAGDLITLLQNIEDQIRDEQDQDDEYIQKLQTECDDNLAKLESEIEQAQQRSAELKAELDEKIPLRDQKVQQLSDKNDFKALIEKQLVELESRKQLKDAEWAEEQEQHDHATSVIQKVKEIIQSELRSFLQKGSSAFAQVANTIRSKLKQQNFKRKSWNSFFMVLAEITDDLGAQADQSSVQKVIELCDDILDKIAESREIERQDYQHWIEEYNNHKQGLNDKLEEVENQISALEVQISTLNKRITDAQYEKGEQDKRAKDKSQQHDEKLQYCEDENKGYSERREARDDERSVVSQTIGLLQANLRTFRKYVKDRTSE